jgi:hypothetical protein
VLFPEAVQGLLAGDFSRLEPLFDSPPGGRDCQIIEWFDAGLFADEPEALAEALTCACFTGRAGVVRHLLDKGVSLSRGIRTGMDGFHWAANRGQLEVVTLLIERKAALETRSRFDTTVLGTALWSAVNEPRAGHTRIIEALKSAGARLDDCGHSVGDMPPDRRLLVQRGLRLNYATLAYNALEAIASIVAGLLAGSIALLGFGLDSVVEVTASAAAQWRLRADLDELRRHTVERVTHRIIGWCFVGLALYVTYAGGRSLLLRERPERSVFGIVILALSAVLMPLLARAKRRVARGLESAALRAEARQTSLCAWLSTIALAGVALNAALGWWWADPAAALAMVPIIVSEGLEGVRAR